MNLTPADFVRSWQLQRRLQDHLGAMNGTLSGTATLVRGPDDALTYYEAGTLILASGAQMAAERRYLWRWLEGGVSVFFADGAPFHKFVPEGQAQGTSHLCGADLYHVTYDFRAWPRWQAVWDVKGPKKDYRSVSDYAPA